MREIATYAVKLALDGGATDAECTLSEGSEFTAVVRRGEVESLTEAGSRGVGIRVLVGKKSGSAHTSDVSEQGIAAMVRGAVEIAGITSEDPWAGLPEESEFGQIEGDLGLYWPEVEALSTEHKIAQAREAEAAAFAFDSRIENSEGAEFGAYTGLNIFANSRGFVSCYRTSSASLTMSAVARNGEVMESDYWYTGNRNPAKLESPEFVGRQAASRAVRRLNARKIATQKAPVLFEARVAGKLLDHLFDAVNGGAVYRGSTYLAGKLGDKIAASNVTIIDDATMPERFGTSPCDDEGVPSRRTSVVENGVLCSYLLNTYSARRLGLRTTGNASRGLAGAPGVTHGNFYLEPGKRSIEEIISGIKRGLLVTDVMGQGANIVTGDYSRGASGLWIENGEIAYPVSEITIASTLQEMMAGIEEIASELEFRSSLASPAVLIREMTISGQGN